MYLAFLTVDLAVAEANLLAVSGRDGRIELFLHGADLGLDLGFVQALHFMMDVGVDVQRLANSHQQVLFVQLRIALHRFMLDALGDLPEFGHGFFLEFNKSISHVSASIVKIESST